MKINPEDYLKEDGEHQKFGNIRPDGVTKVPNRLTLK